MVAVAAVVIINAVVVVVDIGGATVVEVINTGVVCSFLSGSALVDAIVPVLAMDPG